ncbi:D-alanyl-D-alanine carboxypeptidase/D-alanyl-D-alanine-endopeptidase [Microbacterium sp.]|uniref:D-alanyl-D-alanine carboxypeptidase/D-alanyl-D-alanine endopeptidase n=1 Tax=Microbacterium sp. TaxID=51671 RepID=UPI0027336C5A|nr:D-alanyl-D-alanine carboxypeptidase/D-alanyl-D-alanine-endopeptidase [Microbacterium sp.]MDP3952085.1 D-alanyl-D-alanine carboxypeptidase/D-alanyl-D-alanine-endopeptidase [Microbacterium sp.]
MIAGSRAARRAIVSAAALGLVLSATTACTAEPSDPYAVDGLPEAALKVMNKELYSHGNWYIAVADLETGEVLIDLNAHRMAEPGSFVKTYSAGAAWLEWGPDHTITTPVKRSGEVTAGTLDGDLVLVGMGDLTMGGRTKDDGTVAFTNLDHNDANFLAGSTLTPQDPLTGLNELAAQVKASGIDVVSGDVVIDDRLFEGELDEQPVTPIIINQNILDVILTPGAPGEPATVGLSPAVSPWTITSTVETVEAGGATEISSPASPRPGELVVSGTIAADSAPQLKVFALADPATFARTAFIEALERAGVAVATDPIAANPEAALAARDIVDALPSVAELESLPLGEEATYVMKISYNRGAQTFACRLAVEYGSSDCDDGMAFAGQIWDEAGLDITGASLIDGSGLNGNYVTPTNALQIQTIMAGRQDAERWKATMPVLGVDGSLFMVETGSPAAGKVFAKTGSLMDGDSFNGRFRLPTKTLGGVMETETGRHLAFTIMVNQGFFPEIEGVLEANDDVGRVAALIQQAF